MRDAPNSLVRMMSADVEVDVAKRILKRARIMTNGIASDGGIVIPSGISVRFYEQNPQVFLRHGCTDNVAFPVVGRSLGLTPSATGMESVTQFADDPDGLGRQIAYLYGVNEENEVYSRGWSFAWKTLEREWWSLSQARDYLGDAYDEDLVPDEALESGQIWVVARCAMNEYSAVPLGADRKALSRAYSDKGIRLAGEIIARMDLESATREVADLKTQSEVDRKRLDKLEQDILALSRDGASAAARGDTDAVRSALEEMLSAVRERNQNRS